MKFAQAEHKNLECQKQAERAEYKLREMEKERGVFLEKMRTIKDMRSKLAIEVEAKVGLLYNYKTQSFTLNKLSHNNMLLGLSTFKIQ